MEQHPAQGKLGLSEIKGGSLYKLWPSKPFVGREIIC